ncbi:anti-sigma factor family protein [Solicola gregarius]|uniref:Zf-HC2 domain-containing protein n=1 Tax=Solicola gregarius TaxID=2908642 RepID=A0AA46YJI6_9ACTN|nr:zf-HC2 domain-containing protein [Solicola gregarius]UYM04377.1 zf-HC2 domain-containing protein [Solicola gregarius]
MTTPYEQVGDPFEQYDAAYVLGALAPGDRRDFERHLQTCDRCAQSVRELAGMPGIMAHANPLADEWPAPPLPDTLLPRLLAIRDHERRRRTWAVRGLVACAAAALVVVLAVVVTVSEDPDDGGSGGAAGVNESELAFEPVVESPVHASGDLNAVDWGTRIDIDCTYDAGNGYEERSYRLMVADESGVREQVAVWKVRPGQDVALTGSTDLAPAEIASIDIVTADGTSLLRAKP